ncbi:hypothetical protein AB0C81_28960 [Streptomyces roseoverticillatus]|uniref:hypothetical protein n=1 Tax=Streptomyces roseoverticillatus TaxID=66429 RepID=UPI0033C54E86
MRKTKAVALGAVAAVAALSAGCSSDHPDNKQDVAGDPAAAVTKVATAYQDAINARKWQRVCELRAPSLREGSVEECTKKEEAYDAPPPTHSTPSPSGTPEPEDAPTGPVKVEVTGEVPAIGDHPAGQGVILSFNYFHAKETELSRWALRLVQQGGQWLVEQVEDALRGEVTAEFMRATLSKEMRR